MCEPSVQGRLDGAFAHAKHLRDLRQRKPLEIAEHHHGSAASAQLPESVIEVPIAIQVRALARQQVLTSPRHESVPMPGTTPVDHRSTDVGPRLGDSVPPVKQPHERVVYYLFCNPARPGQQERQTEQPRSRRSIEPVEVFGDGRVDRDRLPGRPRPVLQQLSVGPSPTLTPSRPERLLARTTNVALAISAPRHQRQDATPDTTQRYATCLSFRELIDR